LRSRRLVPLNSPLAGREINVRSGTPHADGIVSRNQQLYHFILRNQAAAMLYRNHVFISYAQDNNKPVEEGGRGWIDQFQLALEAFLGRRYGKARIWRDERLRGNDDFSSEIFAQFPDTALLVAVISPSYLRSKWCRDEASKFCELAK